MSKVVKYNNQMNEINFGGYSEKELNMFFSLVFLAKEKGLNKLTIPFSELKELADGDKNKDRFINNLINVNKKLIKLNHQIEINNVIHIFSLFNTFSIDKNENVLIVQVNEIFTYMLNDLVGSFTRFDLIEFVSLKSIYSKNTFKLLKQWESTRVAKYELDTFRNLLGVPKGYTSTNFNERVLKPIMDELPNFFQGLELEKTKTGKKVTGLVFSWKSKKNEKTKKVDVIDIIEISDKLNKAIEKSKKNRFIEKLLTPNNIETLIQKFQENDLIKGLNWAYKEIKQDISTLNYLIKTIKTGVEKTEKKIVVKKSEEKVEEQESIFDKTFEEVPLNFDKELVIEITEEDYETKYQEFLKENKVKHNPQMRKSFELKNKFKYQIVKKEILDYLDIPKDKLLSKNGRPLNGGALESRLIKLSQELNLKIKYRDKIFGL